MPTMHTMITYEIRRLNKRLAELAPGDLEELQSISQRLCELRKELRETPQHQKYKRKRDIKRAEGGYAGTQSPFPRELYEEGCKLRAQRRALVGEREAIYQQFKRLKARLAEKDAALTDIRAQFVDLQMRGGPGL